MAWEQGCRLLVIAYGGRTLSQKLLGLRAHSALVQRIWGGMVLLTAIAILLGWDVKNPTLVKPHFFRPQPYKIQDKSRFVRGEHHYDH